MKTHRERRTVVITAIRLARASFRTSVVVVTTTTQRSNFVVLGGHSRRRQRRSSAGAAAGQRASLEFRKVRLDCLLGERLVHHCCQLRIARTGMCGTLWVVASVTITARVLRRGGSHLFDQIYAIGIVLPRRLGVTSEDVRSHSALRCPAVERRACGCLKASKASAARMAPLVATIFDVCMSPLGQAMHKTNWRPRKHGATI